VISELHTGIDPFQSSPPPPGFSRYALEDLDGCTHVRCRQKAVGHGEDKFTGTLANALHVFFPEGSCSQGQIVLSVGTEFDSEEIGFDRNEHLGWSG
jgi:hypothetical protein